MKEEPSRTFWNQVTTVGDERRDKRERDDRRAQYKSRRKLLMAHLESQDDRVWAARTQATTGVWLGWHTALLQLDDNER